jgi:hypothetical protein
MALWLDVIYFCSFRQQQHWIIFGTLFWYGKLYLTLLRLVCCELCYDSSASALRVVSFSFATLQLQPCESSASALRLFSFGLASRQLQLYYSSASALLFVSFSCKLFDFSFAGPFDFSFAKSLTPQLCKTSDSLFCKPFNFCTANFFDLFVVVSSVLHFVCFCFLLVALCLLLLSPCCTLFVVATRLPS